MPERAGDRPSLDRRIREEFLAYPRYRAVVPRRLSRLRAELARAWSRVSTRVGNAVYERGLHTATATVEVSHFHPDRVWYQASGWTYLRRALPAREVTDTDVFLDLGSGKGRVLLQAASRYPFARVIGVEISESLNDVARANVERRGPRLRASVELITADAAEYEIPDDVTVVYLYYPFVGETFGRVIDNILASLRRSPRRLRVIYALPLLEQRLLSSGIFRRVRTVRTVSEGYRQRIVVYEANPA